MVVIVLSDGRHRFGDLRTAVEGISGKVLTETLRDLERDGLVERHVYAEMPPRVEYELTELGRTLHVPLQALGHWAEQHIEQVLAARDTYDARVQWLFKMMSPRGIPSLIPEAAGLDVDVWLLPNLGAVNLVVHGLLGRGVAASTRFDPQAKGLGEWLRSRLVSIEGSLL